MRLQLLGVPEVVGIEKGNPIAPRERHTMIAGRRRPLVLLTNIGNGDLTGILLYDCRGVVRRSVIDDDDLRGFIRLGQNALDGFPNETFTVIGRNNDAKLRFVERCARLVHFVASRHVGVIRSEERRVGKECRSRWSTYYYKQR